MKKFSHISKSVVCLSIIFTLVFAPVHEAKAFIVFDKMNAVLNKIFHGLTLASQGVTNAAIGLPGSGGATKAAQEGAKTGCTALKKAVEVADAADAASGITTAAVGEGYAKVTKYTARITALKTLKTCYEVVLSAIEKSSGVTGTAGGLQSISTSGFNETKLKADIVSLEQQIQDVKKLRTAAMEQVWKAISIRMLMRAQQTITTNVVRSMTKKYKISNYQDYAGALAGQVYAVDYVNKNFTDNRDQMIVKSMMRGGLAQDTAWPLIRSKAEENLGFDPTELDIKSDNYYQDLAKVGAADTNPYILKIIADDQAQQTISQSQLDAKAEINSSEGMISMRSCRDVSKAEQDKEKEYTRLKAQFDLDEAAWKKLVSRQIIDPKSVSADELTKAVKALAQSRTALNNFVAGNKAFEKPCELIDNPGASLAKYTNSYLASHLDSTANLKETNLPFFAGFLESTASNFLSNIVFQSSSGSKNLTDLGLSTPNISPAEATVGVTETKDLKKDFDDVQTQNVFLSGDKTSSSGNEFNLSWDASDYLGASNAAGSYVVVTGPSGLNKQFSELRGSMLVGNPQGGTYMLKVYVRGQLAVTKSWVMPPAPNVSYNPSQDPGIDDALDEARDNSGKPPLGTVPNNDPYGPPYIAPVASGTDYTIYGAPEVKGVSTGQPVMIRGPMPAFSLR